MKVLGKLRPKKYIYSLFLSRNPVAFLEFPNNHPPRLFISSLELIVSFILKRRGKVQKRSVFDSLKTAISQRQCAIDNNSNVNQLTTNSLFFLKPVYISTIKYNDVNSNQNIGDWNFDYRVILSLHTFSSTTDGIKINSYVFFISFNSATFRTFCWFSC